MNHADPPRDRSIDGHPVFAAVYDWLNRTGPGSFLHEHREYLANDLRGQVLDLGAGTGAMFSYFDSATPPGTQFHGIEPDPYMRQRAEQEATDLDFDITLRAAQAEALPYDDTQFDAVIASVVFCTIPDVERALREVHRVLAPEGEFRFLEHVRSPGWIGTVQDSLTPVWKRASAGCHLNRDTEQSIASSQLELVERETVDGIFPTDTIIRGTAIRRRE